LGSRFNAQAKHPIHYGDRAHAKVTGNALGGVELHQLPSLAYQLVDTSSLAGGLFTVVFPRVQMGPLGGLIHCRFTWSVNAG
jgi:hypothetical protein